jgi:hypothetical protein
LVLDAQKHSAALFEKRPMTIRLFDYPLVDRMYVVTIQRYVPIVLDPNKSRKQSTAI